MDEELEEMMKAAGFTQQRMQFHQRLCDFYEREYLRNEKSFLIGSFAEGWGCNLSRMTGHTSADSDVNLTHCLSNGQVHFSGCCSCEDVDETDITVRDLGEGHCNIVGSNTEKYWKKMRNSNEEIPRTSSHPTISKCYAYRCLCLPRSCTLFSQHNKLSQDLLSKCRKVGVHLVNAQRPGREGKEMRISYALMEKVLIRSFPENIGRAFVLIKFLFKRLLPKELGLKSYMAKTLMFHMMEKEVETLSTVEVALKALELLISFLTFYQNDRKEVCLPDFFQDAPVFFTKQGQNWSDKEKILQRLQEEVERLEETVRKFKDQLGVASKVYFCQVCGLFSFLRLGKYLNLSNFDSESALKEIKSLPEKWKTARAALESLWYLKHGNKENAISILNQAPDNEELQVIVGGEESQHEYFASSMSQWIFYLDERDDLKMMPTVFGFLCTETINFKALLNSLRLELCGGSFTEEKWHQQLLDGVPDFQEVFVFAATCRDPERLEKAREKMLSLAVSDEDERCIKRVEELRLECS